MSMMLTAPPLRIDDGERQALERIARSSSLPHRTVVQAKALLLVPQLPTFEGASTT